MDPKIIQEILKLVNKSDLTEVEIEEKDFRLRIKRSGVEGAAHIISPAELQTYTLPALSVPQQLPAAAVPSAASQPALTAAPEASAAASTPASAAGGKMHTVTSPMIGTFYRKPSPDKELFVKVGDTISKGQVLCIIEAMKLFNEIESEVAGKVVQILVEDSSPVEYEQALFVIELS
ncbi:MAG: acetyl-CoA carboxylase biotin carboxyl carrier protein [Bacteroidetes bacterium]|nr:acetyl-CoA carboxylase biotin carboxyl carrier protein [Bacteroidota bacterium]